MSKRLFKASQPSPPPASVVPLPDGFYIVSDDCIDLGCCEAEVPSCIRMTPDTGTEVYKQPDSKAEIGQMLIACARCPVIAIRYNGSDPEIIETMDRIEAEAFGPSGPLPPPIKIEEWLSKFFKR